MTEDEAITQAARAGTLLREAASVLSDIYPANDLRSFAARDLHTSGRHVGVLVKMIRSPKKKAATKA